MNYLNIYLHFISILRLYAKNNFDHHQAVDKLAKDFVISSYDENGFVHSIEKINEKNFKVGLQCHPEVVHKDESNQKVNEHAKIVLEAFVRKTQEYKTSKEKLE